MSKRGKAASKHLDGRALPYLAAAMVHDARNPLNTVIMTTGVIEARLRRGDLAGVQDSLERITRAVESINKILSTYLDVVGPAEGERVASPVEELVAGAVERALPAAAARGVELASAVADGARWQMDAPGLGLALDLLIANAIEASGDGGLVTVRAFEEEGHGVIEVNDHGEGFDEELHKRLFRVGSTTRRGRFGVGLAVAKHIVRAQAGEIYARSPGRGQGATLRIELRFDEDEY